MNIEVWADVVCPWCYIGKRNLDAALDLFAHRNQITVIWRSFELDPSVQAGDERPMTDVLAEKYGTSVEEILVSQARVTALGEKAGIFFALDQTRNVNSFEAHRLVQFAAKFGVQDQMVERLFAAYFTEGQRTDDHGVLARCAQEVGIDIDEATDVLASDAYADDVRIAESAAHEIGIRGVPFYVIDRKYAVSGAQGPDVLLDVLNEAWASSEG
jgi:predicted DsbA family dithiol-disulfide isomerase